MAQIDNLEIQITANANKADSALDNLVKKLDRISSSLSKVSASTGSSFSKMANMSNRLNNSFNSMSNAANSMANRTNKITASFSRMYSGIKVAEKGVKELGDSIKRTTDYYETFNYFNVSFEKIGVEWGKEFKKYGYENAKVYSESFKERMNDSLSKLSGVKLNVDTGILESSGMKNLGLNIQEVTQYASQLASVTNSVGQTGQVSLMTADAFTKLAGDMSSLFNVDFSTVANNLQSGLIGQSRALYKYGIDITNATLQTYAYKLGVEKAVSEMTQMEKMQLRMIAILDQSKVSWGDLANTINSPSNMLRQFANNVKELGMVFGQLFIPLLQKIAPIMNGITIAIKNLLASFAGVLGIKVDLSTFGQGFSNMGDDVDGVVDSLDAATSSAKKFKGQLQGFDKLNVVTTPTDNTTPNGSVGGGIDLSKQILESTAEYEKVWNEAFSNMENRAREFSQKVENSLAPVKSLFKNVAIGDWFAVGQDVSNIVTGITGFFSKAIANVDWKKIGENIGDFVSGLDFTKILGSIGSLIWEAINAAIEQWKGMFSVAPIETTIITAVVGLKFTGLGAILASSFASAIAKSFGSTPIDTVITAGVQGLFGKNSAALSALSMMFNTLFSNSMLLGIGGAIVGIPAMFVSIYDAFVNGLNWLNGTLIPLFGTLGGAGIGAIIGSLGGPIGAGVGALMGLAVGLVADGVLLITEKWDSIKEWFSGIGKWFGTNVIKPIKAIWEPIGGWFNDTIITPITNFFIGFSTRVGQIFEGLWIIVQATWKIASTWFNTTVVEPIVNFFAPIVSKVASYFTNLWERIKSVWNTVSNWFSKTIINPVSNAFKIACDNIGRFFSGLWSGIKSGVISAMNSVIGGIELGINFIVNGINSIIGGFNQIVTAAAKIAGVNWGGVSFVPNVGLPRIPQFNAGGFPEDGLFYANHNELVGEFSNGKTAVANNAQIVSGIERGVERAVANVLAPYLADIAESSRRTANKDFTIGSRDVFNAVRSENREYINRNGESAFAY